MIGFKRRYIFVLFLILIFAYIFQQNISFNINYKKYIDEKQKWEMLKIGNYQYNISNKSNGYTFIFNVFAEIENGNYVDNDEFKKMNRLIYKYLTIDNIYSDIEKKYLLYNYNFISKIGYGIKIQYDETYHFPKKVRYSWMPIPFIYDYGSYFMYEVKNFTIKE